MSKTKLTLAICCIVETIVIAGAPLSATAEHRNRQSNLDLSRGTLSQRQINSHRNALYKPNRFIDHQRLPRYAHRLPSVELGVLAHIERRGDLIAHSSADDPLWAGTRRQNRRLEGFQIDPIGIAPHEINYMAHLSRYGDTPFVPGGYFVGSRGEGRAVEGIAIQLRGRAARLYDVFYRAHLSGVGDTRWYTNGEFCGTRGQGRRLEAMQVVIVPKGQGIFSPPLSHVKSTHRRY